MSADDEKTRVLQRRAAASPAASPAGKIVFHCPNGHRIIVAAGLAGKKGKCSKCGVDLTIPVANDGAPASGAVPEPAPAEATPVAGPAIVVSPPPVPAPQVVLEAEPPADEAAGNGESWDFIGAQAAPPAAEGFESAAWTSADAAGFSAEGGNPTAVLVGRLWAERQHGGVIELHLTGGSVILPEWYDANWSRGTHGLFASQAADGSVTLTAVAWETVQKVVVRQLTEVPNDMFA